MRCIVRAVLPSQGNEAPRGEQNENHGPRRHIASMNLLLCCACSVSAISKTRSGKEAIGQFSQVGSETDGRAWRSSARTSSKILMMVIP